MKPKRPSAKAPPLSIDDVAELAYQTLRDTAKLFPRSAEDIEVLESELEAADLPKPDTDKLLKMLRGELPSPEPQLTPLRPPISEQVSEGLALAARKGSSISLELRQKMDADRASAEQEIPRSKELPK